MRGHLRLPKRLLYNRKGIGTHAQDNDANLNVGNNLSVRRLLEVRKYALRRGTWFRALSRLERITLDLTIRYVANVKSTKLASVLMAILEKLQLAAESVVDRLVKSVGLAQARKVSEIARSWGNHLASTWNFDAGFARYLAVIRLNEPGGTF